MSLPLSEVREAARSGIDEVGDARFFEDSELDRWINAGARDIARKAECLQKLDQTISGVVGQTKYTLFPDTIRVHRVEWVLAGQNFPLSLATREEMDGVWGANQSSQRSNPLYATFWGFPGNLTMQVFPAPGSSGGTFDIYYYRMSQDAISDSDDVEVPNGWEDLVVLYCEAQALRKDKQARWAEVKAYYDEQLTELINVTRQYHDQSQSVMTGSTSVPRYLWDFDYDGGY